MSSTSVTMRTLPAPAIAPASCPARRSRLQRRGQRFARDRWQLGREAVLRARRSGAQRRCVAAGVALRDARRVVFHPGVEVQPEQEAEPEPEQDALRIHARRASGTGS